ncbi:MAG: hypothetical protein HFJ89_02245 [Oscillospiraceae bacterium]|jgi:predicted HicB family RNase H-like nuclease|nr:hypothetical protein [Oscillospiraceae bacterium]
MAVTKAQQAATKKFEDKNYDKILLRLRKDTLSKETVQAAAKNAGESLNAYITGAISNRIKQETSPLSNDKNTE